MSAPIARRVPFQTSLVVPVLDVRVRSGEYLEGAAGWGEYSPLPSWGPDEQVCARTFAVEAATEAFPDPVRDRIKVNAMVPRVDADSAARLAVASGCQTIKIKVGDAGGLDRVAAVRDALGERARIRLDANGAWTSVDEAMDALRAFVAYDIELVEDPVADVGSLAELRRDQSIPVAAETVVATLRDVEEIVRERAADALVLKPQRFGGVRACLEAAAAFDGPVIASSALETSVGLCAVLALALALPDAPYAHGVGTASLLLDDPSESVLAPIGGVLTPRRLSPSPALLTGAR